MAAAITTPPPVAFSDIAKPANDLLNKDFYHSTAATLEVKSKAPNGVTFNVKGRQPHDGSISGSIEGKYVDKPTGTSLRIFLRPEHFVLRTFKPLKRSIRGSDFELFAIATNATFPWSRFSLRRPPRKSKIPEFAFILTCRPTNFPGLTLTQSWSTSNSLDTKVELEDNIAKGLKAEISTNFLPATKAYGGKVNVFFKQPNFHARAFLDPFKGPTATIDAVVGHEGFVVGAETGYDVQKAAITKYSVAAGYSLPSYAAAITATNNLSVFTASYFHKVNPQVLAGAKATWDSKAGSNVGLEVASKYQIDPTSFAKAKINDRGLASLAYNVKLSTGVTLGLGASFDTQNLNQAAHKVGTSFTFES
ncbi:putative outer mitochondrial membrane protein porin [Phaeomoniella chlamydospora]|uniref:Putative outer mitochondrial membrane protein porin n=1 Tax=Phaeomoniella chlamydospora TaxID=158046 RepID=A0A0G2G1H6_PHACM|nr:putative outer mitochondrial membrane protein porin [Phaeomoniella chlamydospora]